MTAPDPKCPQLFAVPAGAQVARCRSCQAPGYWITTAKARPMLVDCATKSYPGCGLTEPTAQAPGVGISHFITCPHRDKWRKKSEPKGPDPRASED